MSPRLVDDIDGHVVDQPAVDRRLSAQPHESRMQRSPPPPQPPSSIPEPPRYTGPIMSLLVLATGGTFDKRYDPVTGELGFGASHLPAIIERARLAGDVRLQVVMLIDSLEMHDGHRRQVLDACRAAPEESIVVVHGTDTMIETAAVLGKAALEKTIVLTGAMVPFSVDDSDASFNLGAAVAFARSLAHGVWVAMNGVARPWSDVRKNRAAGVFESLG